MLHPFTLIILVCLGIAILGCVVGIVWELWEHWK